MKIFNFFLYYQNYRFVNIKSQNYNFFYCCVVFFKPFEALYFWNYKTDINKMWLTLALEYTKKQANWYYFLLRWELKCRGNYCVIFIFFVVYPYLRRQATVSVKCVWRRRCILSPHWDFLNFLILLKSKWFCLLPPAIKVISGDISEV